MIFLMSQSTTELMDLTNSILSIIRPILTISFTSLIMISAFKCLTALISQQSSPEEQNKSISDDTESLLSDRETYQSKEIEALKKKYDELEKEQVYEEWKLKRDKEVMYIFCDNLSTPWKYYKILRDGNRDFIPYSMKYFNEALEECQGYILYASQDKYSPPNTICESDIDAFLSQCDEKFNTI